MRPQRPGAIFKTRLEQGFTFPTFRSGTFHTDRLSKCEASGHGSYDSCRGCRQYVSRPLRIKEAGVAHNVALPITDGGMRNSLRRATGNVVHDQYVPAREVVHKRSTVLGSTRDARILVSRPHPDTLIESLTEAVTDSRVDNPSLKIYHNLKYLIFQAR